MRSLVSSLGPVNSFTFIQREMKGKNRWYRYRVVFGQTPIIFSYMLAEDGKVAYTDWWDE